jgi:hypothetical protein
MISCKVKHQQILLSFESTLSVASKLLRSCLLELFVVALLVLRIFVSVLATMDLQKRAQEAALSELVGNMSPTAIFNRFDLSASNGQHCGEYRVIYHKNNGNRFFLSYG